MYSLPRILPARRPKMLVLRSPLNRLLIVSPQIWVMASRGDQIIVQWVSQLNLQLL